MRCSSLLSSTIFSWIFSSGLFSDSGNSSFTSTFATSISLTVVSWTFTTVAPVHTPVSVFSPNNWEAIASVHVFFFGVLHIDDIIRAMKNIHAFNQANSYKL